MAAAEAEMEFVSMKRKELQALCKKHGIPANKTNREMALLLTVALKVNEPPATQNPDEAEDLDEENDDTEVLQQRKRVRFSPEVETREYEPTARKKKGRVTRADAKARKTTPDVHVDEASKNLEKDGLSKGSRKLVQDCPEPGNAGRRGKRNASKGTDSEPMLVTGSKSSEVSIRVTRIRATSQSTCNTSAVNKEEDHDKVIGLGESSEGAKRYPSRRQPVVTQTDTFESAELELKGKASKRSSKAELEASMDAQASADANEGKIKKVSAPAGNLKRSRRNTGVLDTSNVTLGANTDAEDSKHDDIEKVSAPVVNSTRSRRKTVVLGTINPVDEVGDDESVVVEEIPKPVIRKSSRQKSGVVQEEKFEGVEEKLKEKASNVPSKSKLEAILEDETSVLDNLQKVSAPLGNCRRSRRKTTIHEVQKADSFKVEESDKVCNRNSSGQNGSDTKELKRKADKLLSNSGLEVIMEAEPSAASKKSIKTQKAAVPNVRRSGRNTVVLSPISADNALGNVEGAEEKLKDKASKVPSKSKLEAISPDEASVASLVDHVQKVSAPVGNLRRSRRKTTIYDVQKADSFEVEESAKAVDRNSSASNGSDAKELKRKADKLFSSSGLQGIMEAEPSAASKKSIKAQKAAVPNVRRSGQDTVVLSPISADNAVGNVEAVGSLCQISEQVSGDDVQPFNESRHSSNRTGNTIAAVEEIVPQSRKGKRGRQGTRVVKRESVVGKPRQSARVNSRSSKAGSAIFGKPVETEHDTTIRLPVTTVEANESVADIIPVEESLVDVVDIGLSGSAPNKNSVDNGEKMEGTPSASSSKLVGSSTYQELPTLSAVSEKTHAEVIEEKNVGSVCVLSEEKLELLHSSEGVCLVSQERNKSSERTENLKEISVEPSFKLVGALMDHETAGSSRKPASTSEEDNPYAIEDDKDEQLGQSVEISEELNHGNLGKPEQPKSETRASDVDGLSSENQLPLVGGFSSLLEFKDGKEREDLLTWIRHADEDQSIESNKKSIPDDESLEAEVLLNQEESTLGHKFSQEGEELVIEVSSKELETNKCHDFSLDGETNEKGGSTGSPKLDEVQTGETSGVKCLVAPLPTFPELRDNSLETNDAYEAACAEEISNQAPEKAVASGEKDIEALDVQPESTIFTERELNLIQGNGNQYEVVESDKQSMKDGLICNDPATLMTENSVISEEAEVQVAQFELDPTDGAPKKWEENASPITQTVPSRKNETFDLSNTLSSGQDMVSPKAARVSAGVAKASDTCSPQFSVDDLVAGTVRYQGTLDMHEHGAGGGPEEFGSLTVEQSERRYLSPGMTPGVSSSRQQNTLVSPRTNCTEVSQLSVEADSNKIKDTLDGSDYVNRLPFENGIKCLVSNASGVCSDREQVEETKISEKDIQLRSKATVDSSGLSTNGASSVDGETKSIGWNLLFKGQDKEADTVEADIALQNDDSRVLKANRMMSQQVAEMELDITDGVSKKWENSSPFKQTVDNCDCEDETFGIHPMFSPGHDMMSPKAATRGSVGVSETFDTHTLQLSIDHLKAGSVTNHGAPDVQDNEASVPEEFEGERSYPIPGTTRSGYSLTVQNVSESSSSHGRESFQFPWEADSSKLAETDDFQNTTENVQVPEGSFKEGYKELQEVENEIPLDAAEREDCPLVIGKEVEVSGKKENSPGSSINCDEQFLHNQGYTVPSEEVLSINMEKGLDGVCDHLATDGAEKCPQVIMSGDLSCCKDAAVSENDSSEENVTQVPCQNSVTSVGEKKQLMFGESRDMQTMEVSNQEETISETEEDHPCSRRLSHAGEELVTKESAKPLDANEHQYFCRDDEMDATGESSSRSLEANDADQASAIQETSNPANEKAIASGEGSVHSHGDQDLEEEKGAGGESDELGSLTTAQDKPEGTFVIGGTTPDRSSLKLQHLSASPPRMADEEAESMGLNQLFEGQDGEADQVMMMSSTELKASSSPGIAVRNDEAAAEDDDDASSIMSSASPFCIPLTNSFEPLSLYMSPVGATMEVNTSPPRSPSLLSSSSPQNASSDHAGKDGAAIDDNVNLPSTPVGAEVKDDGRGEDKQENLPWCSELKILGSSPKALRTPPGQDAASGSSLMDRKLPSSSSASPPAFITTRKPKIVQRTAAGKVFGADVMKENAGRSKLDMQRLQQLGNVTAPPKTLAAAAVTRRRPLQDLTPRRKD